MAENILVAFSGGKDSTAAALLLRARGFAPRLVTMRLGIPGEEERLEKAVSLARRLGMEHSVTDLEKHFRATVRSYFEESYRRGITPNPCIWCNRALKFDLFLEQAARIFSCERFATGHYARLKHTEAGIFLAEPRESAKSQIYFLAMVKREKLEKALFPVGELTLREVREMVAGLPLADERESQDACFLGGESVQRYLERTFPGLFVPGPITDSSGKKIGEHRGLLHYTIGQRRGTRFASGTRRYVVRLDVPSNTLVLGPEEELLSAFLFLRIPNYWKSLPAGERALVKIRYQGTALPATVLAASRTLLRLEGDTPFKAVTPGQFAVLYQREIIVAAGEICQGESHHG